MQIQGVNIQDMIYQSIAVLKPWPTVATFEQFEKRGGTREAIIYVGVASAVAAVVAFLFGLLGGIGAAIAALVIAFISPIIGFAAFAYVLFYVARSQGGTGTQDEVFYTLALFTAPIRAVTGVVGAIPLIGCLFMPGEPRVVGLSGLSRVPGLSRQHEHGEEPGDHLCGCCGCCYVHHQRDRGRHTRRDLRRYGRCRRSVAALAADLSGNREGVPGVRPGPLPCYCLPRLQSCGVGPFATE